jgi:hypothetical protein
MTVLKVRSVDKVELSETTWVVLCCIPPTFASLHLDAAAQATGRGCVSVHCDARELADDER